MPQSSPVDILYDASGNPLFVTSGSAVPVSVLPVGGSDGTNARFLSVDTSGRLIIVQATAANLNATVTQGPGSGSAATFWFTRITDGTNTMPTGDAVARAIFQKITDGTNTAAVKAASTTALATDPALVIAISPNSLDTSGNLPVSVSPVITLPAGAISDHRIGFSAGAGTPQDLRATAYTEQASAAQRSVKSTSVNDAAAGTGARQVTITYYDNVMGGPNTEVVTLNGTTAVNTVATNIRFIEKMEVTSAGSGFANAGTVTLFVSTAGAGGTIGTIGFGNRVTGVGDNQTFWAHHYVRSGKTMYLAGMSTSFTGVSSGQTYGKYTNPLSANATEIVRTPFMGARQAFGQYAFKTSIPLVGPGRFTLYVSATGGNEVDGSFEFQEQ